MLWFLHHLPVGEVDDLVAKGTELEIASAIVLERLAPPVVAIAIGLDNELSFTPEEVDEVSADTDVDLWHGQTMAATKLQEEALELASRTVCPLRWGERESQHLCLANCATRQALRHGSFEIGNGASRSSHGDPAMTGDLIGRERCTAMQADPGTAATTAMTRQGDVDRA